MQYLANVYITLKPTVNDPQGNTIMAGLRSLGFGEVQDVRAGKFLVLRVEAADPSAAGSQVDEMCKRLLANPVIETYRFEVAEQLPPWPLPSTPGMDRLGGGLP